MSWESFLEFREDFFSIGPGYIIVSRLMSGKAIKVLPGRYYLRNVDEKRLMFTARELPGEDGDLVYLPIVPLPKVLALSSTGDESANRV